MKRRITFEQLQELNDSQKQKLLDWWKPEIGDVVVNHHHEKVVVSSIRNDLMLCSLIGGTSYYIKSDVYPLMDIGQMIDFLLDDRQLTHIIDYPGVMCDSLWQEVKGAL